MKRINNEKLDDIGYPILPIGDRTGSRRVAQEQLEDDKKSVQEMLEEIENQAILAPEGDIIEISLDNEWWQDFKERWLK